MANAGFGEAIAAVYDAVGRDGAAAPGGLAIATGGALARALGYPGEALQRVPEACLAAFVGAAPLARDLACGPGEWVLDLGCGAGVDSLVAAQRGCRVLALEPSKPLLARLACAVRGGDWPRVHPVRGRLPTLPLGTSRAAAVLLNGVANLVADVGALLAEVFRVLRPGGELRIADLVASEPLPAALRELPEAWAWCVGGAVSPETWRARLAEAGFEGVEVALLEPIPPLARARLRAFRPPA